VKCPDIGDLVEWFETTGIVIKKRGIEVLVFVPCRSGPHTGGSPAFWTRRDSVEVISESR